MLIEYKFFEPAFYHTDFADWGMAYATALKLGEQAQVLVDTGHHAQGTNIAHIVAFLLDEQRLGGFHFNARRYADDDLIVGTNNPLELFEIFVELVSAGDLAKDVAYMIDQSHNIEPKIEAMLQSVLNCQSAYAKALIVDYNALRRGAAKRAMCSARIASCWMPSRPTCVRCWHRYASKWGCILTRLRRIAATITPTRSRQRAARTSGAGGGFPT